MYGQTPFFPQMPQNPYMQPAQQQPALPKMEVVKVNGENGARAFSMGPNSSAILLDESGTMIWLVTTDGAGYKTVGAFDITQHQAAPAPDFNALEQRIARLEGLINGTATDSSDARSKASDNSSGSSASAGKRYDPYGSGRKQSSGYASGNGG
jgi:hypothetical protein